MKEYKDALFEAHKNIISDIENKMPYKPSEYISGMLDAARIVLIMLSNETYKKEKYARL